MKVEASLNFQTLSQSDVAIGVNPEREALLDSGKHFSIFLAGPLGALQVPQTVIEIEIGPLAESPFGVGEDALEVRRRIAVGVIIEKAMKGKVHLAKSRMEQQLGLLFAQKNSVRDEENFRPVFVTNFDQFLELSVNQRFTHQVKAYLFGQRRNLFDDGSKQRGIHALFLSNHFRAKTALKVADVADLDIDLLKPHSGLYSIESMAQLGHSTQLPPFVAFG